jgi:hypothetical protein
MDNSTCSFGLTGVVPAICDAEAGEGGSVEQKMRLALAELCSAVKCALDDERSTAEDSLRRACEILQQMGALS